MTSGDPNSSIVTDYPPGHPAGSDEFVSVGSVLSGRGMGTGGVLGTRARATGEPTHPVDVAVAAAVASGPTVLIAVDGSGISARVVRTAHHLFGDAATYLAINVGPGPYTQMSWAYVWPVAGPSAWVPPEWVEDEMEGAVLTGTGRAEAHAGEITAASGLPQATPLGDVGDPTSAILRASHHHHADVVIIGADHRSWLSHLVDGSVERELLRDADVPVLVVAATVHDART